MDETKKIFRVNVVSLGVLYYPSNFLQSLENAL